MAQKTIYAVTGITNWDDANKWADNADGSGTTYTNPQNGGGTTYICNLNAKAVNLNVDVTVDLVQDTSSGYLTVVGTRVINAAVNYSGTSSSGMLRLATGDNLTVNGQVTNSSSGYAIRMANDSVCAVVNSGATALSVTAGQGVYSASTGSLTVTGAITVSSSGSRGINLAASATVSVTGNITVSVNSAIGIDCYSSSTVTITGDVSVTGGNATTYGVDVDGTVTITGDVSATNGVGVRAYSATGTCNLTGSASSSATGAALTVEGGALNWTGSATLAASADCYVSLTGGTLSLATASAALALANSGTFSLVKTGGTLNTADAGAGAASIVNQTSTSYATIIGGSDANKSIITGPTLPAAGDVDSTAADYGYAGSLTEPTCVLPAAADVWNGVQYGAAGTEFTGSLPTPAQIGSAAWNDVTSPTRTLTG